jgi:hypothetical protein
MRRFYFHRLSGIAAAVLITVSGGMAQADTALSFAMLQQEAENAYEQRNYKLAEDSLNQAFDSKSHDARDIELARARVLLARIYKDTGRPQKSREQMELADKIYHRLGLTSPNINAYSQSQLRNGDAPYVQRTVIAPAGMQMGAPLNGLPINMPVSTTTIPLGAPLLVPTGRTVTRTFTQTSGGALSPGGATTGISGADIDKRINAALQAEAKKVDAAEATQMQNEIDKGIESIGKDMSQLEKDMDADARAAEAAVDAVKVQDSGSSQPAASTADPSPADAVPDSSMGAAIDAPPMEESGGDDTPGDSGGSD